MADEIVVEETRQEEKPKRHLTEEHKRKVSEGMKGHKASEHQREVARRVAKETYEKYGGIKNRNPALGGASGYKGSTELSFANANKLAEQIGSNTDIAKSGDGTARAILSSIQYAFTLSLTVDRLNPQTMMDALANLVGYCCENDVKVTNQLCYLACKVSKDDIERWSSGAAYSSDPRYKDFAITVRRICSTFREQLATDAKINPVLAIWWQKVYDGYREDAVQATEASSDKKLTAEQIKEKYKDMPN